MDQCYEAQVREIALRQCLEDARREAERVAELYTPEDDGPIAA